MDEKPEYCKACSLYEAPGIVFGEGPEDAKTMYVGEAPGEDEGIQLRPFVGGAGRVLSALCAHAHVSRKDTYVTNLVKCRPTARGPQGRIVNRQPSEQEIRHCAPFLVKELERIQPNVIVTLGNVPLHALTRTRKGVTVSRSVPIEGPLVKGERDNAPQRYKVLPTIHPAAVMRQQHLWPAVVFDLVRAQKESAYPDIRRRPWKSHIHTDLSEHGDRLMRRIRDEGLYHHDLETTHLDPKVGAIRCIGISASSDEIFCFDWTPQVKEFVRELHSNPSLMTVGQNSEAFDIPFQEGKGFEFNGPTFDTMIGFHLLNSALPKDLGFIGATYTDEPYWKDDSMYKAGEDALQHGCCKDVHATARAYEEEIEEIKTLGQYDLYFKQIMPLQPALRRMTKRGVKKDQREAAGWHIVLTRKADEYEAKLKKGLGEDFNVNSNKQLMELLYDRMKLPIQWKQDKIRGARPTVDADALDNLARISNNPLLLLVRAIRTLRKWDATFVQCPQDEEFYVHGQFGCAHAANGRLNCRNPNMQNFPVEIRGIIVPDSPDHVMIARDWSQIEWRIAMALSGDRVGLDALAAGRDAHTDAYAQAFDIPYDEVTKAHRFEAKTYNYGLLYGRGEKSLAEGRPGHPESAIPIERVHDYFTRFWNTYKQYNEHRQVLQEQVARQHYVETAWGRRRYWYTRQNMPEAYNFPVSGTAAHMMYEAIIQCESELPEGASLRMTVHDELVVVSVKEQRILRQALECMRDVMEQPFKQVEEHSLYPEIVRHYYPNGWFCPSDCHIGENWRVTKGETESDRETEKVLRETLGVADLF